MENNTMVPGIIVYTGSETVLEKFSIPILIFVKYSEAIMTRMAIKEYAQIS
ncbi:MAG: hypothetical protein R3237_00690 [Nitrosopumilaceae archaeon]|nr:hypothetical protein [Nitrosopumilaceae archaeon]